MSLSTACRNEHPWTPENTLQGPRGRACRACDRERKRKWAADKRARLRAQRSKPEPKPIVLCSVDACDEVADGGRGWCNVHYQRWYNNGSPLNRKRVHGDDYMRFWSKVNKDGPVPELRPDLGPCWVWTRPLNRHGYAQIRMGGKNGKMVLIHRWAYTELVGPIPPRRQLDHLCRVRHCVNPSHLEPVTARTNVRRSYVARGFTLKKPLSQPPRVKRRNPAVPGSQQEPPPVLYLSRSDNWASAIDPTS